MTFSLKFELLFNQKPKVSHFSAFGYKYFVLKMGRSSLKILIPKVMKECLLGISPQAYLIEYSTKELSTLRKVFMSSLMSLES